ncbi:MAG: MFS transporter [Gammaproteobacteria bacterium]|nr:MFS transporter [Gammaproteobacteria bacterium]
MKSVTRPARILPLIIMSQFTGTSLWFAGNAVILDLQLAWDLGDHSVGYVTSAVQLGFICGTLLFALLVVADRFSPRKVFFCCSLAGALANLALLISPPGLTPLLLLRFTTGFFLAGIYPVGMKIAAGWYRQGLGRALGYLVGALVVGTAFPHLIRASGAELPWQQVIIAVSMLALCGGIAMLVAVPDGPYSSTGSPFNPRALELIFGSRKFRASAFGYFGHMWELYTLWAFIPLLLLAYGDNRDVVLNVPFWSFLIIAAGFLGCAGGGIVSNRVGSARVAAIQLGISGFCCLLSPLLFDTGPQLFLVFMLIWGLAVVGDSPQFSALNAANAPAEYVGSALTIVNSIGFLITVFSIQLASSLLPLIGAKYIFWLLVPGPVVGVLAMLPLLRDRPAG